MNTEITFPVVLAPPTHIGGAICPEIVTDFDVLLGLADSWSRLWSDNSSATIFQSLPWIRAWWKAFGKHLILCTPVVREGSEVVGILPLVRSGNVVRFVGTPGADYCDILSEEHRARQVIDAALRSLFNMDGWRTCKLTNLRDDSLFVRYSRDLPTDILQYMHTQSDTCRSGLVLEGDRNAVIDAIRRKPALRRHRNKLQKTGNVRFCHLDQRAQMHRYLDTLFQQHIGRRAMANESSQFLSPEWREFYHAMVDELNPRNEVRFSILELDGRTIACHFGFECKGSLILYKPTFDVDVWDLSPGDVLLSELLAYARERQLNEVDFTVGRESYKEHFTNQSRDMYCTVLYPRDFWADFRRIFQPLSAQLSDWVAMTGVKHGAARSMRWVRERYREFSVATSLQRIWRPGLFYVHTTSSAKCDTNIDPTARPAMFSDITGMAMQYPHSINAKSLQIYLARLHRGDRCYLIRSDDCESIGWVRSVIVPNPSDTTGQPKPVALLYDFCALGNTSQDPISSDLLDWFVLYAENKGSVACVRIPRLDFASRAVIKKAGFAPWADAQWAEEQQVCNR